MNQPDELKPCPFCGSAPIIKSAADFDIESSCVAVHCENPECRAVACVTDANAVRIWNTRTDDLAQLRAELEKAHIRESHAVESYEESELSAIKLRAELARVTAERDEARAEVIRWQAMAGERQRENIRVRAITESERDAALAERDEARRDFQKAKEWNALTELEISNLRSLNADLTEDVSKACADLLSSAEPFDRACALLRSIGGNFTIPPYSSDAALQPKEQP